ncbi:hypothetical protein [Mycobacteroides abscessus]|uniref:hypothetical protein n=1 Tax=unclassified Desemzia TaxID=2685243 RepID=UPI0009A58359|nr:Uncharacterised protein [Mycobacteroides abscessus subsp. abscessus]
MEDNFTDIPAGTPLDFDQLIFYLEQGREIEFTYEGVEYFISNSKKEGRALWSGNQKLSANFTTFNLEVLKNIKLQDKSLDDIFKTHKGFVQAVF